MTLLCFLLDLSSIPPRLLHELKQGLLQLANGYVVSRGRGEREEMRLLPDRIALCYLNERQLKLAYKPGGNFSLCDFHHAVNNLPTDRFLPEWSDSMLVSSSDQEAPIANLLSMEALYAWGGEDVMKKVIAIGTSVFTNSEALHKSLMDAAERCVTVEFVVLDHQVVDISHDASEKRNRFINSISDLENCVLRRYLPDARVLCGLVKGWLQELRNDIEEPLQAVFLFNNTILGSTNKISCSLFASSDHIIDGFTCCQACRCHGYPFNNTTDKKAKRYCPVTCIELGPLDLIENAVRVGEETVLFLPSFEGLPKLRRVSAPIKFNVIERTNLASLNEGVIVGTSYVATPSEDCDKFELNTQLFHGLCGVLFELDQGLVCSSTCNTETMMDGTFQCFYILQPSDRGPMLLRRLAASEEILSAPDAIRSNELVISKDMEKSIHSSLSKIELRDYSPLEHERGVNPKLNRLVSESLQFGSVHSGVDSEFQNTTHHQPSILDDWEQLLIIDEMYSPTKPSRAFDEKTSKILERLEAPTQHRHKASSPSVSSNAIGLRMPLRPVDPNSSQLMKPSFQGFKRKKR